MIKITIPVTHPDLNYHQIDLNCHQKMILRKIDISVTKDELKNISLDNLVPRIFHKQQFPLENFPEREFLRTSQTLTNLSPEFLQKKQCFSERLRVYSQQNLQRELLFHKLHSYNLYNRGKLSNQNYQFFTFRRKNQVEKCNASEKVQDVLDKDLFIAVYFPLK